jgi:fatty-acyl-CoA synthase
MTQEMTETRLDGATWRLDNAVLCNAHLTPDKPALIYEDKSLSYAALSQLVDTTASWLASHLVRGDRFACYSMNHPEYFVLLLAASRIGVIMVPLNWRLSATELAYQLRDCAPKLLVYGAEFAAGIDALTGTDTAMIRQPIDGLDSTRTDGGIAPMMANDTTDTSEAPLLIVYTSGTTGRPKGAVLPQRAMRSNAKMSQHAYSLQSSDVVLNVLPLFHVGGLNIHPVPALISGATVILHRSFDPAAALYVIAQAGVTLMNSVPTILGAMVTHENWAKTDLSSMRLFSIGSTDVPVALIRAVHNRQIPVVQIYGATETAPSAIYQTADIAFETIGSIGRQGCDNAIRLVDLNGGDVPDGEVGEIWVRGKNVLTGYWRDKAATSANLTDGWFHTGDLARRDANGLYWFADRLKHVIISGGENIYPAELERLLTNYTALAEFCVVGRDDERWGQVPVVVAVRREEDVTEIDILRAFEKQVARFKQPKAVIFVEKLPRNALGKILIGEVTRLIA